MGEVINCNVEDARPTNIVFRGENLIRSISAFGFGHITSIEGGKTTIEKITGRGCCITVHSGGKLKVNVVEGKCTVIGVVTFPQYPEVALKILKEPVVVFYDNIPKIYKAMDCVFIPDYDKKPDNF